MVDDNLLAVNLESGELSIAFPSKDITSLASLVVLDEGRLLLFREERAEETIIQPGLIHCLAQGLY